MYTGFRMHKIWQILQCFAGTFHQAQILKLGGVILYVVRSLKKEMMTVC